MHTVVVFAEIYRRKPLVLKKEEETFVLLFNSGEYKIIMSFKFLERCIMPHNLDLFAFFQMTKMSSWLTLTGRQLKKQKSLLT